MTNDREQFLNLMQRVRAGEEDAVRELLSIYGEHIYRSIRRRLNRALRSKFDSSDFAQAVWGSFFANRDVVQGFDRPEALVAFLARMANNKVIEECRRRLGTAKHDINRERRFDSSIGPANLLVGDVPTPSQLAVANEQWHRLTAGQPSRYRRIVEMRAAGETFERIAETLCLDERTVRRIVQRLAKRVAE